MGEFSVFHWLLVLIYLAVVLIPTAKILKKAGFSGWWALLAVVPLANLIGLWVFAITPWKVAPSAEAPVA
jgi:uncharacterized membrane protein YhaH (DUF805 family)